MDPKKYFKTVARDDARLIAIAKKLSENTALVQRYKTAIDLLPKDKEQWELEPNNKALKHARTVLRDIDHAIRQLAPGISNNDCLEARGIFCEWAMGRRQLD